MKQTNSAEMKLAVQQCNIMHQKGESQYIMHATTVLMDIRVASNVNSTINSFPLTRFFSWHSHDFHVNSATAAKFRHIHFPDNAHPLNKFRPEFETAINKLQKFIKLQLLLVELLACWLPLLLCM